MSINKNTQLLLHLSLAAKMAPNVVFKILKKLLSDNKLCTEHASCSDLIGTECAIDLSILYQFSVDDFRLMFELTQKQAEDIDHGLEDRDLLDAELFKMQKSSIKIISIFDAAYPECLRHIHFPPIILYCAGESLPKDFSGFAIVGARGADEYSYTTINRIVPNLVLNKWSIVSGGAVGADTMVHKATLDSGGQTVVILGSGILRPYPEDNIQLFNKVVESGGSIVSPFALEAGPERWHFPARNRIISGLSKGCLVVQAAAKSGALITAFNALEQGRLVFAVPGRVDDKLSAGCNMLIKQGAKLVCDANDILEEFGQNLSCCKNLPSVQCEELQNSILDPERCDIVLSQLDVGSTVDELMVKTGMDLLQLQDRLFKLQLEGMVQQTFTGAWEKCK